MRALINEREASIAAMHIEHQKNVRSPRLKASSLQLYTRTCFPAQAGEFRTYEIIRVSGSNP